MIGLMYYEKTIAKPLRELGLFVWLIGGTWSQYWPSSASIIVSVDASLREIRTTDADVWTRTGRAPNLISPTHARWKRVWKVLLFEEKSDLQIFELNPFSVTTTPLFHKILGKLLMKRPYQRFKNTLSASLLLSSLSADAISQGTKISAPQSVHLYFNYHCFKSQFFILLFTCFCS